MKNLPVSSTAQLKFYWLLGPKSLMITDLGPKMLPLRYSLNDYQPKHNKTYNIHVNPEKTQISLCR